MNEKSTADILSFVDEMVEEGIWETREEAVAEYKLRLERSMR